MNMNVKSISEEILESVSGGRPIGRDGKPISGSEYLKRKENDGIHVTSATFGPEDDGIHVTSATFYFGNGYTSTNIDGIHTTSATF